MKTPGRILLLLVLAAAAAFGVFLALNSGTGPAPGPEPDRPAPDAPPQSGAATGTEHARAAAALDEQAPAARREAASRTPGSAAEAAQGVHGRVVDARGRPLAGLPVYLVESPTPNLLVRHRAAQQQLRYPPAARVETAPDGAFRLGLTRPTEQDRYQVHVISPDHADRVKRNLVIQPGDWSDLGNIVLEDGTVIRGRVVAAGSRLPVPGAQVRLHRSYALDAAHIPEQDATLEAVTDAQGAYEFAHAPTDTTALEAVAPNFVRVRQDGLKLEAGRVNEIDFRLQPGHSIHGQVVDPGHRPIPGATVVATPLEEGVRLTARAESAPTGRFEVLGLEQAGYRLRVSAPGYQTWTDGSAVTAGSRDVLAVLTPRNTVLVRVLSAEGTRVRRFRLGVRRHNAANDQIARLHDVPDRTVLRRDHEDGWVAVDGLPDGRYVIQVEVPDHAKTFSEPFTVAAGQPPPRLEIEAGPGGTIHGVVVDTDGRPIPGVTVHSEYDGHQENSLTRLLDAHIPRKITVRQVRTDDAGRYELVHMAPGTYQLDVRHPDFCHHRERGIGLSGTGTVEVAPIRLQPGAVLEGFASHAGERRGQLKVIVSSADDAPAARFKAEAFTDNEGHYRFRRRIPPGRYRIQALRQSADNVFQAIIDAKESERDLVIPPGRREVRFDLDIPGS